MQSHAMLVSDWQHIFFLKTVSKIALSDEVHQHAVSVVFLTGNDPQEDPTVHGLESLSFTGDH